MERIIGVDPGLKGAFCYLTLRDNTIDEITFEPMPLIGNELDLDGLIYIFSTALDAQMYIEKVTSFKMGAGSAFTFGKQIGTLETLARSFKIAHSFVTPQGWQKEMHEGVNKKAIDDPKQRSLVAARRLFPETNLLRSERCKFPDSGFVDALLIAEYGRRKLLGSGGKTNLPA